ncbi:MAG: hypothetical protein GX486_00770 [Acetobacter sp.]|nr:hypothetical protein [Acetobacter sp.]
MTNVITQNLADTWGNFCSESLSDLFDRISSGLGFWCCSNYHPYSDAIFFSCKIIGRPEPIIEIERTINFKDKFIVHDGLIINPEGRGYGRKLLRNSFDIYRAFGFKVVKIKAGMDSGPYVWARFGFLPTTASWENLRQQVHKNLEECKDEIDEYEYQDILEDIDVEGPRAVWILSDKEVRVGKEKLGYRLLKGQCWEGFFNFDDPDAVLRFESYVGE